MVRCSKKKFFPGSTAQRAPSRRRRRHRAPHQRREAGGIVEPIRDGQDMLDSGQLIAAAEPIFNAFASVIRDRSEP